MKMSDICFDNIPECLRSLDQWVLWKVASRKKGDKPTKLPFTVNGHLAKADDPATWCSFPAAYGKASCGGYAGIGFEFSADDPYCGVDLDGCRDPETGTVAEWAREIIIALDTYAEVSPSKTGVKLFMVAKSPMESGKKKELPDAPKMCGDKNAAIEIYDWGRYFAVTGLRLKGPREPQPRQEQLAALVAKYWPTTIYSPQQKDFHSDAAVVERARKYLACLPPAISGSNGSGAAFHAACVLVLGFGLDEGTAMALMAEYNQRCVPPWSERELQHKVRSADKQTGQRNYLRNSSPERWDRVTIPKYDPPVDDTPLWTTTLADAAQMYLDRVKNGQIEIVETGLPDMDYALGGGLEKAELIIIGGLPSHGKSAVALQCVHHWTTEKRPGVIISEEMSTLMLGKRTLQFNSDVPEEHWVTSVDQVQADIEFYRKHHVNCTIVESCGTTERAVEEIEKAVVDHKAQFAVVDYAQLLSAAGGKKTKYQETSDTSRALKKLVLKHNIFIVALCQLNRDIEKRPKFMPCMSDLKDTGQFGQDADVVLFVVWPHRIDSTLPPSEYTVFVAKNKNRGINQAIVNCKWTPSKQMLRAIPREPPPNFSPTLAEYEKDRKDFQ